MVVAAPATNKHCASNHTAPVVVVPPILQNVPQQPKDLPQETTLLIKEWLPQTCKKKETGEEFKMFDLVDVNSGL